MFVADIAAVTRDKDGNVVIASSTRARDIPTSEGCFQPRYGGGRSDWFAAKISADMKNVIWCTYAGGSGDEGNAPPSGDLPGGLQGLADEVRRRVLDVGLGDIDEMVPHAPPGLG